MSDKIVFDVLCTKVLDALRALGLGKFSIRNYYYEGMWPIIKVYRSEGVIFYSAAFTNEIVNRFHLDHENGLVADRIWAKVRKASILFEEYVQTGKIVWKRVRPDPKISLAPYYHELLRRFCQHEANPHQLRHSRAMHLYRAGMPLVLLAEFLGHADVNTTRIYAWADTEMKRQAIQKVSKVTEGDTIEPIWANDEELIKRLYGLA